MQSGQAAHSFTEAPGPFLHNSVFPRAEAQQGCPAQGPLPLPTALGPLCHFSWPCTPHLPVAFLSRGWKPQVSTAGPLLGLCPALQCPRWSSSLMGASPEGDGSQGLGLLVVWWLWADSCAPAVPGWCLHPSAPVIPRTGAEQDPRVREPHCPPSLWKRSAFPAGVSSRAPSPSLDIPSPV